MEDFDENIRLHLRFVNPLFRYPLYHLIVTSQGFKKRLIALNLILLSLELNY
jgi:hypothetical protein